jgi:hypothetical protein
MNDHNRRNRSRVSEKVYNAAAAGIIGLTSFGVFDVVRSIGQGTQAESLADNVRIAALQDFNHWEAAKDYIAPQMTPATPNGLTNNENKAPLSDPSRSIDFGHLALATELIAIVAVAKGANRKQ